MNRSRGSWVNFLTGGNLDESQQESVLEDFMGKIVGEGFFYKEGSKVKNLKYRKYCILDDGRLVYFSPNRKLFLGSFDVSTVDISVPQRRQRRLDVLVSLGLGSSAFEMHLKNTKIARPLILIFKTDEEAMLFLFYLTEVASVSNAMSLVASIGMTTLYSDCERIVRKAQLQSLEHRAGGEAGEGGTGSPDADLTGHQADVIEDDALGSVSFASPPPKSSAHPERKAPAAAEATTPLSSITSAVELQPVSTDANDLLFMSLWSLEDEYDHSSVMTSLKFQVTGGIGFSRIARPLWWRLALGLLSAAGPSRWAEEMLASVAEYEQLRRDVLPVMADAAIDPLSQGGGLSSPTDGEWNKYYKAREKANFIQLDINRLYLSDVDDSYFEDRDRRISLQNILVLWSSQHDGTSYRQGMHELAGTIYYAVEAEVREWTITPLEDLMSFNISESSPIRECFVQKHIEAFVFWLFTRMMRDLEGLYDPAPVSDGQPFVIHYCFAVQENLLRQIDPDLCAHLEGEEIHCQLYGMRWARLLLGREFPSVPKQVLRVWDYLIVSANAAEKDPKSGPEIGRSDYGGTDDLKSSTPDGGERKSGGPSSNNIFIIKKNSSPSLAPTTDASVHSKLSDKKNQSGELESNVSLPDITACVLNLSRSSGGSVDWTPLPPTSLLAPMQFIMVSMLVSIRRELLESDNNAIMGLLMRYPDVKNVQPILDLAYRMESGLIKLAPQTVTPILRKRDVMYKNLLKIGQFGSRVTQTIARRTSALPLPSLTLTPGPTAHQLLEATPGNTSPRGGPANPSSRPVYRAVPAGEEADSGAGFEMEMNVAVGGLFSPAQTRPDNHQNDHVSPGGDVSKLKAVSKILINEGNRLGNAASLLSAYVEKLKYEDDLNCEWSSDEDGDDNEVPKKKRAPVPPPSVDTLALAAQLRTLADILEGKRGLDEY